MSKEKPFENKFAAFYKKSAIDLLLFAYVCGFRRGRPGAGIKNSVVCFLEDFKLSEDDYPIESALRTYTRIKEDFLWLK